MEIISTIVDLKNKLNTNHKSIGFVPTMGALHNGHLSLIKKSSNENNFTIVSIFINPTQFLDGEDLDKYPRTIEKDIEICKENKVDILFLPTNFYESDEVLIKAPKIKGYILEGAFRPGHFDGVLQVVLKLFNLIQPTNAYFGKKDTQQLLLIKQMVKNLFLDINVIGCDTIRDSDNLAKSSRNVYLSKEQRKEALKISRSLQTATGLVMQRNFNCSEIIQKMGEVLAPLEIFYIEILNHGFEKIQTIELGNTVILVEVKVGSTRLLDNIWL